MNNTENIKTAQLLQEHLLDYVAYTLTSAKGLYREPHSYGPMRMIDSMERALHLLKEAGIQDDALEEGLAAVRNARWKAMTEPEEFGKAMDESILNLVDITVNK